MTEILSTLLPLLAIWLVISHQHHHPWKGGGLAGAVTGLATLVQPQSIVMAPVLGFASFRNQPGLRRKLIGVLLVTITAFALVAPWTYRNCRVMDGCAIVSTNGGWNLAIGSFPRATGRFETLRASDGCAVVTGQVHQDRCWGQLGWEMIRSDPMRWISLIPKKWGHCFDHASFPVEYIAQVNPEAWPEERRASWRSILTGFHHLLLSVAAFGFIAWRVGNHVDLFKETALRAITAGIIAYAWYADAPTFWPLVIAMITVGVIPRRSSPRGGSVHLLLVATLIFFVLTHAVFFGEDRYHVRLIPMFCLLAAAAFRPAANVQKNLSSS